MPEDNMNFVPRNELLTFEEMSTLLPVFQDLGIEKLRFTGGEPLVRKGILTFFSTLRDYQFKWYLTTNGVLLTDQLQQLVDFGLKGVNLSFDTLQEGKFLKITRRNDFKRVQRSIELVQELGIRLKINAVIQKGVNDDEIFDLMGLAAERDIEVRFIEFMPFNGKGNHPGFISADEIKEKIESKHTLQALFSKFGDTAETYQVDGFLGKVGVIPAFTRTFCGTCNRLRMDAQGAFRTCLYGPTRSGLREMIRNGASKNEIKEFVHALVLGKERNGFEAEEQQKGKQLESMSAIGG